MVLIFVHYVPFAHATTTLALRSLFTAGVTPEQIEAKTVNARAQLSQIQRVILANQPRVTRHEIPWDDEQHQARLLQEHQEAEAAQVSYRRRGSHCIISAAYSFVSDDSDACAAAISWQSPFLQLIRRFRLNVPSLELNAFYLNGHCC